MEETVWELHEATAITFNKHAWIFKLPIFYLIDKCLELNFIDFV